jgi:predicted Holliday junction resolvase-like endonuclease
MDAILFLIVVLAIVLAPILALLCISLWKRESAARKELARLREDVNHHAMDQFRVWKEQECESIRSQERDVARREATTQLAQWRSTSEQAIRSDAIQRSTSVIIGKVTEHLVPYMSNFSYNPKDVRFIGSPIDLVIFDGMSDEEVREIIFVEVKTGASAALTKRERQIRDAVCSGKVRWIELRVSREG